MKKNIKLGQKASFKTKPLVALSLLIIALLSNQARGADSLKTFDSASVEGASGPGLTLSYPSSYLTAADKRAGELKRFVKVDEKSGDQEFLAVSILDLSGTQIAKVVKNDDGQWNREALDRIWADFESEIDSVQDSQKVFYKNHPADNIKIHRVTVEPKVSYADTSLRLIIYNNSLIKLECGIISTKNILTKGAAPYNTVCGQFFDSLEFK